MTQNDLNQIRGVIKEEIKVAIEPIKNRLDDPDTGLSRINTVLDTNTSSVVNIEQVIKAYGDMYKVNDHNSRKLEKRVEVLEDQVNIIPSPELTLTEVS